MENASKALIIAGAILLAIIIISLGLVVVNRSRGDVENTNLDKQTMEAFNSEWDVFVGDRKTASDVKSLCAKAIANNASEKGLGTEKYVSVTGLSGSNAINISEDGTTTNTKNPAQSNTKTYKIEITGYENGVVSAITVTANP